MVVSSIPAAALSVGWYTGMGDRLRAGVPPRYVTSNPGQLSLLTLCGTGNEYWPLCGDALRLEAKAGWLIPFVDKSVGGR